MRPAQDQNDQGFALVAVLWAIVIISTAVVGVTATTWGDARRIQRQRERAELAAAADAILGLAVLQLVNSDPSMRITVDGSPFVQQFAGRLARVRIQDEAGLIDLNKASSEMLGQLLRTHGMSAEPAQALVDVILDWRQASFGKRLNGAKADDYSVARLPYGPRNGPFTSVEELKLVLGMPQDLFDKIKPSLTVHSQSPLVDLAVAPRPVLGALSGMSEDRVLATLEARSRSTLQADVASLAMSILQPQSYGGHAFTITVELAGQDPLRLTRTASIRLTGQQGSPLWVYRWH